MIKINGGKQLDVANKMHALIKEGSNKNGE